MKTDVFNPDEWQSPALEEHGNPSSKALGGSSCYDAVLSVVEAIEASAIDITALYADWLAIAFALVSEFGEAGRPLFHRISRFNADYSTSEADKQYSACLRDGSRQITIATLFHLAKSHGINLPAPSGRRPGESVPLPEGVPLRGGGVISLSSGGEGRGEEVYGHTPKSSPSSTEEVEEPEETLPTFSQSIRSSLPSLMQRIVTDSVSDVDADLLILGSLTVFSACMPNVFGVYDRREVFANLFLFVTARASAGKGRLSLCRHLVEPIHKDLREKYRKQMKKFKEAQAAFVVSRKNALAVQPQEPPFLTLFVPANSTATVVYQTLSENNGVGLLFETEGDTLANAFNSDLGNYSDGFRKAFHHETISYLRKKDHEYVEILKPKFSAVLSGTPQQILHLIPDSENGLFSRFVFYAMPTELVWHDMFAFSDGTTADEQFKRIALDFHAFYKVFSKKRIQFTLSRAQQERFNAFFDTTQREYAALYGDDIIASVRRLGLILFRFAMILTVLRLFDDKPVSRKAIADKLVCADDDFLAALTMVRVLLMHTASVYQSLPRKIERLSSLKGGKQLAAAVRQSFFEALPATFNRSAYLSVARMLNFSTKTAERYIAEFCKSGQLTHPALDQYQKSPVGAKRH